LGYTMMHGSYQQQAFFLQDSRNVSTNLLQRKEIWM